MSSKPAWFKEQVQDQTELYTERKPVSKNQEKKSKDRVSYTPAWSQTLYRGWPQVLKIYFQYVRMFYLHVMIGI